MVFVAQPEGRGLVMTLYDFRMLTDSEQIDLLYQDGVYIGKRVKGGVTVVLYQYDAFYVEVFYRKYRCHIQRIYCFTSTDLINPYLQNMDVAPLVAKC